MKVFYLPLISIALRALLRSTLQVQNLMHFTKYILPITYSNLLFE